MIGNKRLGLFENTPSINKIAWKQQQARGSSSFKDEAQADVSAFLVDRLLPRHALSSPLLGTALSSALASRLACLRSELLRRSWWRRAIPPVEISIKTQTRVYAHMKL